MNIIGQCKIKVISKTHSTNKEGNTFYKLGVLSGSEVGMISCSEEIYNSVEVDKMYDFVTVYNDSYKSFRLNSVVHGSGK